MDNIRSTQSNEKKRPCIQQNAETWQKGKYRDKFKILKHLAQKKTREAYWNYISDIIAPVDSTNERPNPKKFFTYLKSISKESNGVPTLKIFGETVNEIQDKTNLLNRQFQSVFTTDTDKKMPDIPKEVFKEMPEITITENV